MKLTFHTGSIGTVFLDIGLFKFSILLKEAAITITKIKICHI